MVYEISLLQPTVLRGLIERFTAPEELTLLNKVPTTNSPDTTAVWEITRGSRTIADFNIPNSEANIVDSTGRQAKAASFAYIREKKIFTPTTVKWLRAAGSSAGARDSAEAAVTRELADLNRRLDNRAEWLLWQALGGKVDINVNGSRNRVNYEFRGDHYLKPTESWKTASPINLVKDIRAAKRVIRDHGKVEVTDAYTNEDTFDYIFDAFVRGGGTDTTPAAPGAYITDSMKQQYYSNGTLPNFMGLNWHIQGSVFDSTGDAYTDSPKDPYDQEKFLADNKIVFGNFNANRPIELVQGPSADFDAAEGYIGKFTKTWIEPDPASRQALMEWHILPVVTQPDQFAVFEDITAP